MYKQYYGLLQFYQHINYITLLFTLNVGESKIIRNVGKCFAVGYTAGWA
jgi:hypothetical protein